MRSNGIENLKAVVRRSRWLILALIAIGVIGMNVLRSSQGPEYQATAEVILSPTDLAFSVAGFDSYVDPELVDQTESALAESREFFDEAADLGDRRFGSGRTIEGNTDVQKDGTTITFSVTSSDRKYASDLATLLAETYPEWRASVSNAAVTAAIEEVESQVDSQTQRDPELAAQLSRLRILQRLISGNVLLVEPARSATKTRPSPIRDSLLGGFIGLFVALVAVGIREAADTRVRSESEIEDILNVPVVGTIETLPRRSALLTTGANSRTRYGDVYALLAANLTQSRPHGVFAITSATPGEGKTTTAVNLAATLARRAEKVALVDLDRRRPSLSKVLHIPADAPGVEAVLGHGASIEAVTWGVPIDGNGGRPRRITDQVARSSNGAAAAHDLLHVLPVKGNGDMGDALNSDALTRFVTSLRKTFDYVVIDTAPALSVPDVTELAEVVDVVLIVVRHGRVSSSTLTSLYRLQRSWPRSETTALLVGAPRDVNAYPYYAPV